MKTRTSTPECVKKPVNYLWIALTFFGVAITLNHHLTIYDMSIYVMIIVVWLFLILATLRGYNWARMLLFGPLIGVILAEVFFLQNGNICLLCIVTIIVASYGMSLLFKSPAHDWFSK
jgi:membrane-bound ClpP family serine protease